MSDEKTGIPTQPPQQMIEYPTLPAKPGEAAPPPYYQPPAQQDPAASPEQHGQATIARQTQVQPDDYLAFAICVTICCCLPLGIVGIIKSTQVRSLFNSGEYQQAEESSRSAKKWSCAGLVTGLIIIGGAFIFYMLMSVIFATPY